MVNRQYAVSGSLQVAAITSKAIGGSVSAATRPPKEVRDPQTNANLYTSDFGCDMMVGFDNSQKADRFPDQSRGDRKLQIECKCVAAVLTHSDYDKNTFAQYQELKLQPVNTAPVSALLPNNLDKSAVKEFARKQAALQMGSTLLSLGGQPMVTQTQCSSLDCDTRPILGESATHCPDCEGPVAPLPPSVSALVKEFHTPPPPPNKPTAEPTLTVHPQPVIHKSQSIETQSEFLKQILKTLGGNRKRVMQRILEADSDSEEEVGELLQWLAFVGDVTTVENFYKAIEKNDVQGQAICILGLFHEQMYFGSACVNLLLALGGPELAAELGIKTPAAQGYVS